MAGASDPLEDMLFSEVDEKAVSDLVGSLESQLVGQSDPPAAQPENTRPGSGKQQQQQQAGGRAQLPAHVDSPSEPQQQAQQQQQNARKATRNPDPDPKDASPEKHAKALDKESPLKSHGSIIIITTAAASDAPAPGNKGESPRDTRKKHQANTRSLRSAASHSLNGNGGGAASASPGTSSTTFTVTSNPQAIALDRGTPTIALHRLPRHIIASIAQKGNGTSVSALVNHSKPSADAPGNNALKPSPTSLPPVAATAAPVRPAVSVSAAPVIRPAQTQPPAQQRLVTPQLIVRPPQQQTTIQLPPGFTIPPGTERFLIIAHW